MRESRRVRPIVRTFALAAVLVAATTGAPVVAGAEDPVLVGAGDIADCTTSADTATAELLDGIPGTVFTLGDNAYERGSAADFRDCYVPTWGRHKARTRPSVGNHDYLTADAKGYFGYFGTRAGPAGRGYYAYDLGAWRIIVLDSNCAEVGGCTSTSPQGRWLRTELTAAGDRDVLAYWHHPRYSSGVHGGTSTVRGLFELLYAAGADVVLVGHDHDYERFAPQDPWGRRDDATGIRQFVVGTGGTNLRGRASQEAHSEVFASWHGVLRLTLRPGSYDWIFEPAAGGTFQDAGTAATHGRPTPRATRTFTVASDATVDQARPSTNFGTSSLLRVDGDAGDGADRRAYLKATVTGLPGVVDRAALRLWVTNPTVDGPRVLPTTTRWSGRTITWRTRPSATGSAASDHGRIVAGEYVDLDVTAIVTGNGTYGFLLWPTSPDGLDVDSLQGAHPPRLIVQTVAAPGS
jgi:hypothetical protein